MATVHNFADHYFPEAAAPSLPAPLWARLLGKRHRDDSYRFCWGEVSTRRPGWALKIGCYGAPHLNVAIGFVQVFINLPMRLKSLFAKNSEGDRAQFGFSTTDGNLHLNWGHRCKIFWTPLGVRWAGKELLAADGTWVPEPGWKTPEDQRPQLWQAQWPFHYMTADGEAQHVIATCKRSRVKRHRIFFGLRLWKMPIEHVLEVAFSEEVGNRRGSWKGGVVGTGITMKPGEEARQALRRMQTTMRFCR